MDTQALCRPDLLDHADDASVTGDRGAAAFKYKDVTIVSDDGEPDLTTIPAWDAWGRRRSGRAGV